MNSKLIYASFIKDVRTFNSSEKLNRLTRNRSQNPIVNLRHQPIQRCDSFSRMLEKFSKSCDREDSSELVRKVSMVHPQQSCLQNAMNSFSLKNSKFTEFMVRHFLYRLSTRRLTKILRECMGNSNIED